MTEEEAFKTAITNPFGSFEFLLDILFMGLNSFRINVISSKCIFAVRKINFLDFTISTRGLSFRRKSFINEKCFYA